MRVIDLPREQIESVLYQGRLYRDQRDPQWFPLMHPNIEITEQPTGDYVGEELHIHMRPRQDPIIHADKFASSSVAST